MKVSIILDKKSRFNIDLPEIEAKQVYKNLVGSAISGVRIQAPTAAARPHQEVVEKVEQEGPKVEEIKNEIVSSRELVKQSEILQNQEVQYPKKIVMVRCTSCNQIAVPLLNVKDGELAYKDKSITCKHCQSDLPIGDLKPARYECPNCSTTASFYVMNGLKEAHCKNCGSLIDLVWHEKKGQYLSANLIK